jgi:putative ABC transport system permease protein
MKSSFGELRESLSMALSAIAAHKLRSTLTLLGVLVGVFSIILVMTAMRAMQNNVEKELGQLGSRTFVIEKMPQTFFGRPTDFMKFLRRPDITLQQARRLKARVTLAEQVGYRSSFFAGDVTSRYSKSPPNVSLQGGTPGIIPASNWIIVEGRPLLDADVDSARDVVLLSKLLAEQLFPQGSPVGQRIKIAAISYTVVGILSKQSSANEEGGVALIPITTALNRYGRWRSLTLMIQAPNLETFEDTMEQARGAFRSIRKVPPGEPDDFELLTSDSMITQFEKVTFAVRTGLTLVSSVALLAAGVGIMNIMLVSVTERTREIGIRRAIGAKKRNIMTQFIIEAIVLCEIGGILGIASGMLGANALAVYLLKLPPAFPLDWAVIALVICSLIGIIFGSYPAYKAANLDPIESLRYE